MSTTTPPPPGSAAPGPDQPPAAADPVGEPAGAATAPPYWTPSAAWPWPPPPSRLASVDVAAQPPRASRAGLLFGLLVLSVTAGLLLAVLALPVVGGVGLTVKTGADTFNDLPSELVMPPLPQRSVFTDSSGRPFAVLHGAEDRISVPLERIPVQLRRAIVSIEDRRFYEHHGIDYKGVARAAVTNQENGAVTQGGSTLTQQYVKNVLITLADTPEGRAAAKERSLKRKLREARYAIALEKKLSKDQILTNYLNIAYFGDGAYGVATAAQHYFGKDISAINLDEAALLAGLVQNPNAYDPKLHPAVAKTRRNQVLTAMRQQNFLSDREYRFARDFPVRVKKVAKRVADGCEAAGSAAFFCQYLRSTLLADPTFGATPEERQRKLYEGGLVIRTTLDPTVQAAAQQAADSVVPSGNRVAAAVVVLQPGTGDVEAMAVNRRYAATSDGKATAKTADRTHTKLNYALQPTFQAGSTFKVFTLATALEQGLPLSTTLNSPSCYHSPTLNNPGKCFHNAGDSESGVFSMSKATWDSVNTYYVQLEERTGVLPVRDMARRLGVTSDMSKVGPADGSFTLGTTTVSPMQMATVYATLAAHGKRCTAKPVVSVTDSSNRLMGYTGPGGCQQVLDPGIADTVTSVLQGVIRAGTARAHGSIGRPAAGKTGTTEGNQSAWFDGYIPQLAAAVWVGDYRNPQGFPLAYSPTTRDGVKVPGWSGGPVYGGDLPTEIWAAMMRAASRNLPVQQFPPPDGTVVRGAQVAVPDVLGQTQGDAFAELHQAGFSPVSGGSVDSAAAASTVARTSPGAGSSASPGATVTVYLSDGVAPTVAPTPPTAASPSPSPSPSPTEAPASPTPRPSASPSTSPRPQPSVSASPTPRPSPTRSPNVQPSVRPSPPGRGRPVR